MKFLTKQGLQHFLDRLKGIIPSKTSDLTNDSGFLTSHNPVDSALSSTSTNAVQNKVVKGALDGKSDTGHTHTAPEVSGLSTVATSGSYNDLSNTPTIPVVNNKTLTIQKNGTTVNTFTANSASDVTANITVPTAVSELTNDSGYLTSASSLDSSKLTGTIDIARLPKGALERLVTVANQTARFALTVNDVQLGDTVKQLDTGVMYIVVDESKLSSADGYTEYTAGSATSVPWSGVTGKPSSFTPSSHTHGNVTNDGKLPTASRALISDSSKNITVSSVTDTELGYLSGVTSSVQTQLNAKAADSGVVHKTGNESIAGTKTFSDNLIVKRNDAAKLYLIDTRADRTYNAEQTTESACRIEIVDKDNVLLNRISAQFDTNKRNLITFTNYTEDSNGNQLSRDVSFNLYQDGICNFYPVQNNAINLGTSSNKWKSVYADSYYLGTTAFGDIATHNASEFSASNHVHGNITNDGKVGTTANKPLITGTGGAVQAGSFGNAANTFCEGNDSRLSDARTPVAHTHLTADVTDLLNSDHTWTSQQSYNSDLNLNYANTDVDDIVNSVAGSATLDNFVHMTGNETVSGIKSFPDGVIANVTGNVTGSAAEFSTNKSITLTGLIEGTASSKGGWTIPTSFRYGYGGRLGSTTEEFIKLASGTVSGSWNVYNAIFLCNADERFETCLLQLGIFVNQAGNIDSPTSVRLFVKSLVGLPIGRLYLGYKNNSESVSFEIYAWNYTNQGIRLQLLSEFIRRNSEAERTINLHTNVNISSIPSEGFTLVNAEPATIRNDFSPFNDNTYNLGDSTHRWKTVNGINPGALSLPDNSNVISIDTTNWDLTNYSANSYTPPADGWIFFGGNADGMQIDGTINYGITVTKGYDGFCEAFLPVFKDKRLQCRFRNCTLLKSAVFYPCLGNV